MDLSNQSVAADPASLCTVFDEACQYDIRSSLPVLVQTLCKAALSVAMLFVATYLFTSCRFHLTSGHDSRFKGKEPPTLPYWIPYLGNAWSMVTDPHSFYEETLSKRPDNGPVTMRLGPISMYLIFGAENVQAIFRNSRSLSFEHMQLRIAEKVKGLPTSDKAKLGLDDSGSGSVPLNDQRGDERIWHNLHNIYLKNLTERSAVDFLTRKFVVEFAKQIDALPWKQTTTGLYAFLQQYQGKAENQVQFSDTFWEYDAAFMTLMQGMPRFMCRKGWAARDRTLEATKMWLREATEAANHSQDKHADPDWDESFGHRLVRERNAELVKYGISFDGRAAMHMGLIWAINANAVPMTAYILFELARDPALLQRIRAELRAGGVFVGSLTEIDIAALVKLPLLNSVYSECLRLRSSIPISRRLRDDVVIDGYTLKKDSFLLAPSWLSHINEAVWAPRSCSSGPSEKTYNNTPGAQEFWAERFLYLEATKTKIKLGDYCPYGGGSVICPGRFFAKHEILAAVAMVVTRFDLGFEGYTLLDGTTPSQRGPGMENAECRGIVSLDRDMRVTMRRRDVF
ncbi:Cholesterol 7-alpha-monooxygenase [Apiospora saccharicola]